MINKERLENLTQEVWKGAIKLRGKFKAKDYPSVILPMIMIRRIECVLEEKREAFKTAILVKTPNIDNETLQKRIKIQEQNEPFYNKSNWTFRITSYNVCYTKLLRGFSGLQSRLDEAVSCCI